MAGDYKRYIDEQANPEFAAKMRQYFDSGRIPPFAMVFPETQKRQIASEDKPGKQIIQFSFLLTNAHAEVLPYSRTELVPKKASMGHEISLGRSVLVGWSPAELNGRQFPQSEEDMRDALSNEVTPSANELPPEIYFLGLARRTMSLEDGQTVLYYFYIFECRYSGPGPVGKWLLKDRNDRLAETFVPVDDALLASLGKNRVDLRALEALTDRDFSARDSHDCYLLPGRDAYPPFMVRSPGVFFCHSSLDKRFVEELAARLEKLGIPTWVDKGRIEGGNIWFEKAFEAIKYCQVFLFVASANTVDSIPCKDELDQALNRQRRLHENPSKPVYEIIPVALEGDKTQSYLPKALVDMHAIDLRDPVRKQGLAELIARIKAIVPSYLSP